MPTDFESIREFIMTELRNNQFLSGGVVVVMMTAILTQMREVPMRLWTDFWRFNTTSLSIYNESRIYPYVVEHVSKNPKISLRARHLKANTESITPGECTSWYFDGWRLVRVIFEREDDSSTHGLEKRETLKIKVWGRKRDILEKIMEESWKLYRDKSVKINYFTTNGEDWYCGGNLSERHIDSVILKEGQQEDLVGDLERFIKGKEKYAKAGIPYRRGYLLEGPPGTGKSSTVLSLCSHFKLDVYILSLNNPKMDDAKLLSLASDMNDGYGPKRRGHSVLLIEDCDTLFSEDRKSECQVTLGGLLNALDGVSSGSGRIAFLTTNHVSKLDPALIRAGRVDRKFHLGILDSDQAGRMYDHFVKCGFNPETTRDEFVEEFQEKSPADAQEKLVSECFA